MVAHFLEKQRSGEYRVSISQQELTAHDVASRILRRENFLIALIDQNVLDLRPVIPVLGPCPCRDVFGVGTLSLLETLTDRPNTSLM